MPIKYILKKIITKPINKNQEENFCEIGNKVKTRTGTLAKIAALIEIQIGLKISPNENPVIDIATLILRREENAAANTKPVATPIIPNEAPIVKKNIANNAIRKPIIQMRICGLPTA